MLNFLLYNVKHSVFFPNSKSPLPLADGITNYKKNLTYVHFVFLLHETLLFIITFITFYSIFCPYSTCSSGRRREASCLKLSSWRHTTHTLSGPISMCASLPAGSVRAVLLALGLARRRRCRRHYPGIIRGESKCGIARQAFSPFWLYIHFNIYFT